MFTNRISPTLVVLVALGSGLSGCIADADQDGLSNREEEELGLDPNDADTDADGLDDGSEFWHGTDPLNPDSDSDFLLDGVEIQWWTDPLNPDTDDDGYLDGDEVDEGSDPHNPKSRIYKGHWPYNRDKDDLSAEKRVKDRIEVGGRFPRVALVDQHGEEVDLYDFAGSGKDILLNLAAENCGPNFTLAEWLSTGEGMEHFRDLHEGIDAGEVYWIELAYTSYYTPTEASPELAADWAEAFPNKRVPVLADEDLEVWDFMYQGGTPFVVRLNSNMIVQSFDMGYGPNNVPMNEAQDALDD